MGTIHLPARAPLVAITERSFSEHPLVTLKIDAANMIAAAVNGGLIIPLSHY